MHGWDRFTLYFAQVQNTTFFFLPDDFSALVKDFWMETTGKQLSYQKKRIKIEEASQTVGLGRNGDWAGVVGTCLGSPTRGRHRGPGEEISRGKKQVRFYGALWTSP